MTNDAALTITDNKQGINSNSSEAKKLQWHSPFRSAMKLDLREDADRLIFHDEYHIGTKPMQIDLVIDVIEDKGKGVFASEIANIFRKMNLMEYKSPGDSLGKTEYYKVMSYAYGFISLDSGIGYGLSPSEVSLSLVREEKPVKLLKSLTGKASREINPVFPGIYHINNHQPFPLQVIVTSELSEENHVWLKSLTRKLSQERAMRLLNEFRTLINGKDKINGNSVIDIAWHANKNVFDAISQEDKEMLECLRYWYEPEMEQIRIDTIIETAIYCGQDEDDILKLLMDKLSCTSEKAKSYFDSYKKPVVIARAAQ